MNESKKAANLILKINPKDFKVTPIVKTTDR